MPPNEVKIRITADGDDAKKGLDGVRQAADRLSSRLSDIAKPLLAVGGAFTALGGVSLKFATDLQESINAVNVVFGEASETIHAFGENSAQAVGLSTAAFNQLATVTGAMLANVGFSVDETAEQTVKLTQRAADMASVFNTDVDQALNAINAALRGEIDPIERFGVAINEQLVNQKALALGLADTTSEITLQDKQMARLALIYEQTDKFAGDFQRTSGDLANRTRILKAQLAETAASIGTALIPVVQDLLNSIAPVVTRIGEWIQANPQLVRIIGIAAAAVAGLGAALFGLSLTIGAITTVAPVLGTAFTIMLGPIGLAIAAVGGLVAAFVIFRDKIPEALAFVGKQLDRFIDFYLNFYVRPILDGVEAILGVFGKDLPEAVRNFVDSIDDFSLEDKLRGLGESARESAGDILNTVRSLTDFESAANAAGGAISRLDADIKEFNKDLSDSFERNEESIRSDFEFWRTWAQGIEDNVDRAITKLKDSFEPVVRDVFERSAENIQADFEFWKTWAQGIEDSVDRRIQGLKDSFRDVTEAMRDAEEQAFRTAEALGRSGAPAGVVAGTLPAIPGIGIPGAGAGFNFRGRNQQGQAIGAVDFNQVAQSPGFTGPTPPAIQVTVNGVNADVEIGQAAVDESGG